MHFTFICCTRDQSIANFSMFDETPSLFRLTFVGLAIFRGFLRERWFSLLLSKRTATLRRLRVAVCKNKLSLKIKSVPIYLGVSSLLSSPYRKLGALPADHQSEWPHSQTHRSRPPLLFLFVAQIYKQSRLKEGKESTVQVSGVPARASAEWSQVVHQFRERAMSGWIPWWWPTDDFEQTYLLTLIRDDTFTKIPHRLLSTWPTPEFSFLWVTRRRRPQLFVESAILKILSLVGNLLYLADFSVCDWNLNSWKMCTSGVVAHFYLNYIFWVIVV